MTRATPLWFLFMLAACGSPPTAVERLNPNDMGGVAPRVAAPTWSNSGCTPSGVFVEWSVASDLSGMMLGMWTETGGFDSLASGPNSFRRYDLPFDAMHNGYFRFGAYAHRDGVMSDTVLFSPRYEFETAVYRPPGYSAGPRIEIHTGTNNPAFTCSNEPFNGRVRVIAHPGQVRLYRDTGTGFETTPIYSGTTGSFHDSTFTGDRVRYRIDQLYQGTSISEIITPWFEKQDWLDETQTLFKTDADRHFGAPVVEPVQATAAGPIRVMVQYMDDFDPSNRILHVDADGQILVERPLPRGRIGMVGVRHQTIQTIYVEEHDRYFMNYAGHLIREVVPGEAEARVVKPLVTGVRFHYLDVEEGGGALVFARAQPETGQREVIRHRLLDGAESVLTTFTGTLLWLDHNLTQDRLMWIEYDVNGYRVRARRLSDGVALYSADLPYPIQTIHRMGQDLVLLEADRTSPRYLILRGASGLVEQRAVVGPTQALVPDNRDGHLVHVTINRVRLIHAEHPETTVRQAGHAAFPEEQVPLGFGLTEPRALVHQTSTRLYRTPFYQGFALN